MSRRSSKSSSSAGEFDVCAVSATSTPAKSPPPRSGAGSGTRPGSEQRSPAGSPSLSTTMSDGRAQAAQASPARAVQFSQRRRSSGSSRSSSSRRPHDLADLSSRFLGSDFSRSPGLSPLLEDSLNGDSVARLLDEEAEDVRLASMLAASVGGGPVFGPPPPRFPLSESLHHAQRDMCAMPVGDSVLYLGDGEEPSNLSPAEVAVMMHHLEQGVSMTAPPEQLFKFLFPNASRAAITRKASGGEEGGVRAGAGLKAAGAPNDNTLHKGESCPIVCFGTGFPARPQPRTCVQLRGDTPPKWFPGYFVALPETGGTLQVKRSPTEVMQAAYMAARPRNIPPECRFVY
ncbi:uncharacterized protein LOC113211362 [Frankliniella occidentalis]|uniref:Uncharacterized protein LOC113211362 n=1 Tax=Frankliniella occidentalis TaxID=133901 RepID=A0A6J1SW59_FRAOC|nr:uncharacterized protein LOC113211362 [Frankliniella occidentalis]